jgi:hypothetical protein
VLVNNAFDPIAVLESPLLLLNNAESPTATILRPSAFSFKASVPIAILLKPVMLACPARNPQKIFPVAGCNSPAGILFTLKRKGWLSVLPINWLTGLVPLLPVRFHALLLPDATDCQLGAAAVPIFTIN